LMLKMMLDEFARLDAEDFHFDRIAAMETLAGKRGYTVRL